jgi:hypothetical protein
LGGSRGLESLTGYVEGDSVTLFGAAADTNPNNVYGFHDTLTNTNGAAVNVFELVNSTTAFSGSTWNLRGVAMVPPIVPEPSAISLIGVAMITCMLQRSRRS